MKRVQLAIFSGLALVVGMGVAPAVASAHPAAKHPALRVHMLKGRLDTYATHTKAILDLSGHDRNLQLSKQTKISFAKSVHHVHLLSRGDHVQAFVQKVNGKNVVVKMNDEGNAGGDTEGFNGAYVSSTATSLTIQGQEEDSCSNAQTFTIDANTQYVDQNGNTVSSLTYTAGEALEVDATRQADGSWLATTVTVSGDQGGGDGSASARHGDQGGDNGGGCDNQGGDGSQGFDGAYASSSATSLVITDCSNASDTFTLDGNTTYFDADGNQVSSLTYTAGESLHVEAVQQSDGSWLAVTVSEGGGGDNGGGDSSSHVGSAGHVGPNDGGGDGCDGGGD